MRYIVDKKGSHTLTATKNCIPFIQSFIHKGIHKKRKEMAAKTFTDKVGNHCRAATK